MTTKTKATEATDAKATEATAPEANVSDNKATDAPVASEATEAEAIAPEATTEATEAEAEPIDWSAVTNPALVRLLAETTLAEASLGQAHPIADLAEAIAPLSRWFASTMPEAKPDPAPEGWSDPTTSTRDRLALVLADNLTGTIDALTNLGALAELIAPYSERVDRTTGDSLVTAFQALRNVPEMMAEAEIKLGDALVTRWQASAPARVNVLTGKGKAKAKTGAPTYADLPKKVIALCACNVTKTTGKDNLNSQRDAIITHTREQHGTEAGRGSMAFQDLTRALVGAGMTPQSADDKAYSTNVAQGSRPVSTNVIGRWTIKTEGGA